jgi:hypothetical protein
MEGSPPPRPYRRSVGFPSPENRTPVARRSPLLVSLSSTCAALLCLLATASPSIAQSSSPTNGKGPVGWDSYRRLDLFPQLRSGTETRQFSSTDPAQANGDFNHPFRQTSDGQYVITEANGPGEIVSIWSTINVAT